MTFVYVCNCCSCCCWCVLVMLQTLPLELGLEIFSYLSLHDIVRVKTCSRKLNKCITQNQDVIIQHKLKSIYNINTAQMQSLVYIVIHKHNEQHERHRDHQKTPKPTTYFGNKVIDNIFLKVMYWYNMYNNLEHFPNKLDLFILYRFIKIIILPQTDTSSNMTENNISFINELTDNCHAHFQTVATDYYRFVLEKKSTIKLQTMHKMSKYATTLPIIKKLFGCYTLNLTQCQLVSCCEDCNMKALREICQFKMYNPNDYFLSSNYYNIKLFLYYAQPFLFRNMLTIERKLVNSKIVYHHPYTQRRIRLNSRVSRKLMFKFCYEDVHIDYYHYLQQYILTCQNNLLAYYFK